MPASHNWFSEVKFEDLVGIMIENELVYENK